MWFLRFGPLVGAVMVGILLPTPTFAQVSTFELSGTVLDPSAAVLPGVTVSLRNTKTGLVRTEATDDRGRYHFIALPVVGDYSIKIDLAGFAVEERAGLVFQANSNGTCAIRMLRCRRRGRIYSRRASEDRRPCRAPIRCASPPEGRR
jgi:hypothetical protein